MYYSVGYLIGVIIVAVVFGLITKHINESKGYQGGFAWGFWLGFIGIIVVACRSDTRVYTQTQNRNTADSSYSVHHDESVVDELKKYKELMDEGIITQLEFQAKKEQLLKEI